MIVMCFMKKAVGYFVAVVGLVVMVLGSGFFGEFDFGIDSLYVSGVGIVLVIVGALVSLKNGEKKKVDKGEDEIPIYEGVGKNRKIVGYRKG